VIDKLIIANLMLLTITAYYLISGIRKSSQNIDDIVNELIKCKRELLDLDISINRTSEALSRLRSAMPKDNPAIISKCVGADVIEFRPKCPK
jgi:hypothetical protein